MRRYALLVLCSASSLGTVSHAQTLRDRTFCDSAPIFEGVNGEPAPSLIGQDFSNPATRAAIGHNEFRRVAVNGSERPNTIVNQWPKPGVPIVNHFLLLCVSAGNIHQDTPPPPPIIPPVVPAHPTPPPPPQPQKCPDGTLAPVGGVCPAQPQHGTQVCPDGSRIDSTATCPGPKPENPCPGGNVDPATGQCERPPPPPPPQPKCPDGTVQPVGGICPPSTETSTEPKGCPEGSSPAADGTCQAPTTQDPCKGGVLNPATGKCESEPPKVEVPNVSGETEEQAIRILERAGFTVARDCCSHSPYEEGRVAYTQPGPGELIPKGSQITYMMSEVSPPPLPPWLIVIATIATLAVAALAWLATPKRPRISVRLPFEPTATVAWGDPMKPEVEVAIPAITSNVEFPPYKERKS